MYCVNIALSSNYIAIDQIMCDFINDIFYTPSVFSMVESSVRTFRVTKVKPKADATKKK